MTAPSSPSEPPSAAARIRGGLGRGLGALIPRAVDSGLLEVAIDRVVPSPLQPRYMLDESTLEELAESIRQHGVLQPLIVARGEDDRYVLIAGERRWRAARRAGLQTVPVVIKETTPRQRLEIALVENLQRQDLNPLETAQAYRQLVDEHGLTREAVAERVGKNRATVANTLRLLNLPPEARDALASGTISEGHARAILACDGHSQRQALLNAVVQQGLSVRQAEELARRLNVPAADSNAAEAITGLPPGQSANGRRGMSPDLVAMEDRFRQALGTKIQLVYGRRGGKLVIHFYSDDQLQGLFDLIRGADEPD